MSVKKPSMMKREYEQTKKDAAFYKKQSEAYAAAIMALADDNRALKEIVGLAISALRDAVGPKRPSGRTLGPAAMESLIKTVNEVLAAKVA
jgi:hypothetical protein